MFNIKYVSLILILYNFDQISSKYVTRELDNGRIRGFVTTRASNVSVEHYLGIPYAVPPVGNLRFEYPEVPKPWNNTLDTLTISPACPQVLYYLNTHVPEFHRTSEDCLYLNVYVPQILQDERFHVLLYIHGGGNSAGMGAMFGGDILAAKGHIIVVTFNYRLGILGFAAARNEGLEGNYGFLDQVLAMKWVKSNIHHFGGDPDKVTIHGHSAGAVDVGFHLVSPLSKGFFKQAVIHSASPLATFAMISPEWTPGYNLHEENVKSLCPKNENKSLKLCLKSVPVEQLISIRMKQTIFRFVSNAHATIDGIFLQKRPEHSFKAGKFTGKSFLLSFTNAEWVEMVYRKPYPSLNHLIQKDLHNIGTTPEEYCSLKDLIPKLYNLTEDKDNLDLLRSYAQVVSDFLFVAPMIQLADMMVKWTNDLYISSFDLPINWDNSIPAYMGAAHGKDLFYIFGTPFVGHKNYAFTEYDRYISDIMITLYSNFVKHGYLTLDGQTKYKTYTASSKIVNSITYDNDSVVVAEMPKYKEAKMKFWNEYFPNISKDNRTSSCSSGCSSVYFKRYKDNLNASILFVFGWLYLYRWLIFVQG